ncbi:long-chain acyl-CoA synthetase [Xanthobacter flavus]|uniref:Dicarboxylate--CoA ligase PimA n=1 Tax=Xanthobacter flavus TaxID=281 RepID=A0A9W6FIP1_XANFL|nr:long-chain fatty acid--CoA ligase [Xanthobacter flavus]MBN8915432.1 long-chain fatty acid--CoA ligase [Hyphomicrobiales bacterium]MDR6332425.1 long-chain acyl-CoA synthetase [Xanthobacter flavus]GLI21824.1 dicarboxylate--CoA ligase PimA [Xanthobacter flavus]
MLHRTDAAAIAISPVPELLEASVAAHGAKPALSFLGRKWTYAEVGATVNKVAAGLQAMGVGKGTHVGLCLPNTPYSVIFFFAVMKAGGTVVNFSPLYVERELRHQIRDSGTTIMVVPDLKLIHSRVVAVAHEAGLKSIIVCPMSGILPFPKGLLFNLFKRKEKAVYSTGDGMHVDYASLLKHGDRPEPVEVDPAKDLAVLQYTGGTTGVPKGAMLTHANVSANARQLVQHAECERIGVKRVLGVLPLFHVFAMQTVMLIPICLGAEIILVPRFNLMSLLDDIEREKPTMFPGVPTIYAAINNVGGIEKRDLSSLTLSISGGAPLPLDVRTRFQELTGCPLVEGYGLSESSPVVSANPPLGLVKDGSVGTALPETVIEIRDLADSTRLMPVGQKGEVCVRGPQVMAGYWNRPDETTAVFVDGALRTGDVGLLDEDGYLFLVDRIKDVILCGGYNVYPRMIEEALYLHPAVAEAVAIGIPDSYRGQAPKAFVTLRKDAQATPAELMEFLSAQISKIEMPKAIEIRDSLPKSVVGKLSKKELVEEERQRAAAG